MEALSKKIEDLLAALERLSRREKFMVGGLAICFIVFVVALVSFWVSSSLGAMERRIQDKTTRLQTVIDYRQQYEEAKRRDEEVKKQIQRGRNIDLVATLTSLEKQLGVNIEDLQTRTPGINTEKGIEEVKVEVNIPLITIDRLVELLEEVERKSKTIAVRVLRVRNNFRDPTQLDVNMTVSNFQLMKEQEGPAKGAPSKRAKK
jgi:glycine cleavage system regulatory protein